jgi:hypothetical protein
MDFLIWLEATAFAQWVRESSSLWAYPTILMLHTIGLGFLVGINAAIDLRIIGFGSGTPIAPMERFFPVMWIGFWVNAVSGIALTIADATTKLTNPVFYIKLLSIALALVAIRLLKRQVFRDPGPDAAPVSMNGKALAWASLFFWAAAITAGRLTAYIGPVSGLDSIR